MILNERLLRAPESEQHVPEVVAPDGIVWIDGEQGAVGALRLGEAAGLQKLKCNRRFLLESVVDLARQAQLLLGSG